MHEHWDLLESDFQRFYSMDLRVEIDRVGARRLCALLHGLPPEAAVWRVAGQEWTTRDELLALLAERVDQWGWVNAHLHGSKEFKRSLPKESLRVPRPGEAERERRDDRDRVVTDPAEIAAFFI